tara:strand:- start:211 stop:543 length:333 start_codon:yes stop_codon:yes gene_type:complete
MNDNKIYKEVDGVMKWVEYPPMTEKEKETAIWYSQPASAETILRYLKELAMHKRISGGEEERRFVIKDMVKRLNGVTEPMIFYAVNWFIENDDGDWFPQVSVLRKKCGVN